MRDPNRIPKILNQLRKIWEQYPDLRLEQLILNCFEDVHVAYYMEDDKLIKLMKEAYLEEK